MHLDVHPFIIQDHCNLSYEIIIGNCGVNEFFVDSKTKCNIEEATLV